MAKHKKPFIPRDKPKSYVLCALSSLVMLFIATPLAALGIYNEITVLLWTGAIVFCMAWVTFVIMMFVHTSNSDKGNYDNIKEKKWSEQVW